MTIPTTLEGLIEQFKQDQCRLQRQLDALSNHEVNSYVVRVGRLPIKFVNDCPIWTRLDDADLFLSADVARDRARSCVNGLNERGVACTLEYAYVSDIEHLRKMIDDLQVEVHYQGV